MSTRRYPSPLRYPGGKGKVASYVKVLLLSNDLVGCEYVEPYAGGSSVALSLLFEDYASRVHINDLNRSIFHFWNAVLNDTDALCDRILRTPVTVQEWKRQRAVQTDPEASPLELAFSTFFLNRTSRSGILGGGVIGGLNQRGTWKIDARYNKRTLVRRIEKIARYRSRITLTRLDTAQYLRHNVRNIRDPFLYLDPPYYVRGRRLYENFYRHEDHAEIALLVRNLRVPWVVSYDAVPEIKSLYRGVRCIDYDLKYSAGGRYAGSECMFFSDQLKIPEHLRPASVSSDYVSRLRLSL